MKERKTIIKISVWKRNICLLLAVLLLTTGTCHNSYAAEAKEKTYKTGYVRALIENYLGAPVKVSVLYCEEDNALWIDGEEFQNYLNNYIFYYDQSEGTVRIDVWEKQFGLRIGSNEIVYKIGESECFYRLDSAPVKKYKDRIWIPAEPFFYLTGCNVYPVSVDGDETAWEPKDDFLVIEQPQQTVMDILHKIYNTGNGLYWAFSFENDFMMTEEQVKHLLDAAGIAVSLYGVCTGDVNRILSMATQPFHKSMEGFRMLSNNLFHTEWEELPLMKDVINIDKFLAAMLVASQSKIEAMEKEGENASKLIGLTAENILEMNKAIRTEAAVDRIKFLESASSGPHWNLFKEYYDEIKTIDQRMDQVTYKMDDAAEVGKTAAKIIRFGTLAAGFYQRFTAHDAQISKAMECYLNESQYDTEIDGSIRNVLEMQFLTAKRNYLYASANAFWTVVKDGAADLTLGAVGLLEAGIVTALTNVAWHTIEKLDILPLPKASEPEAMQMAMYSMMYQTDSWREAVYAYESYALGNGMSKMEDLEHCAYLTLNYLNSCYVTIEAGLEALRSAEFAQSDLYKNAEKKRDAIAQMIAVLSENMEMENRSLGYGVLQNFSAFLKNDLTYELFVARSLMENGRQYGYKAPILTAPSLTILPLAVFSNNYYEFIRDELLPRRGYAKQVSAERYISYNSNFNEDRDWDRRNGLLGADIVDLNQDSVEDLLVYSVGEYPQDEYFPLNHLIVELYSMDDEENVYLVKRSSLGSYHGLSDDYYAGGLLTMNGKTYLYLEYQTMAKFADGGALGYVFYEYAQDGTFLPRWNLCKSDGGSSDIAYSLFTRTAGENYEKAILYADMGFGCSEQSAMVYMIEHNSLQEALRYGFDRIGLPQSSKYLDIYQNVPTYLENNELEYMSPSFCLKSQGIQGDGGWNMKISLEDYTELEENIKALEQEDEAA